MSEEKVAGVRAHEKGSFHKSKRPKWTLDLTDAPFLDVVSRVQQASSKRPDHPDWAVFKIENTDDESIRKLAVEASGTGNVDELARYLKKCSGTKYAMLSIKHGHIKSRRWILLIVWSIGKDSTPALELAHLMKYRQTIKNAINAIKVTNISSVSRLKRSMIISELSQQGMIDEILLRCVVKKANQTFENGWSDAMVYPSLAELESSDSEIDDIEMKDNQSKLSIDSPSDTTPLHTGNRAGMIQVVYAGKNWTLKQFKKKIAEKFQLKSSTLQISFVPDTFASNQFKAFNSPRSAHFEQELTDEKKKLFELNLTHGSLIYVSDIELDKAAREESMSPGLSAQNLKLDRQRMLEALFTSPSRLKLNRHASAPSLASSLDSLHNNTNAALTIPSQVHKEVSEPPQRRGSKKGSSFNALPLHEHKDDNTTDDDIEAIIATTSPIHKMPNMGRSSRVSVDIAEPLPTTNDSSGVPTNTPLSGPASAPANAPTHKLAGLFAKKKSNAGNVPDFVRLSREKAAVEAQAYAERKEQEAAEQKALEEELGAAGHIPRQTSYQLDDVDIQDATHVVSPPSYDPEMEDHIDVDNNIDLDDIFILQSRVGQGKTATVHKALYRDCLIVALKEFKFSRLTQKILDDFHKELRTLKQIRHPNTAILLGAHLDEANKELYLVLEWLPGGCLYDVVHSDNILITYWDVLTMSLDIARGMEYLHSMNIIHRDLKSHNLLLDEEYRVKVTDFGTARHLDLLMGAMTEVGTVGYMAPEVVEVPEGGYNRKVDVFSYAILLWEIYCAHKRVKMDNPLAGVGGYRYMEEVRQGLRPSIPEGCPEPFEKLLRSCWRFEPDKRPEFAKIVKYLESLMNQLHSQDNFTEMRARSLTAVDVDGDSPIDLLNTV